MTSKALLLSTTASPPTSSSPVPSSPTTRAPVPSPAPSSWSGPAYYISSLSGDDSRTPTQAKNPTTPWKTISKLNSMFSTLDPGHAVLFKRGEVFYGTLIVSKSGTANQPLVIGAYGSGDRPLISELQNITNWTSEGGGIYSKVLTTQSPPNLVTVNGVVTPKGRYPNAGTLTYEAFSGSTSITDNQLTNTPNWSGAEVVIRVNPYTWGVYPVSSHMNSTITYSGSNDADLKNDFGYFFQNDIKCLDLLGEWAYRADKLYMYFGNANPSDYSVKVSTADYAVYQNSYQNNRSFVRYENLAFEGGNRSNILINGTSTNNSVVNCSSNFSGRVGINLSGVTNGFIDSCLVENSNVTGILFSGTNSLITNNTINNTAVLVGMAPDISGSSGVEILSGSGNTIQYNHVYRTGKHGIFLRGNESLVKNNLVEYAALTHDDVGGIYTSGKKVNSRITDNIVLHTAGNKTGCTNDRLSVEGIYLDSVQTGVTVEGNTVAHSGRGGLRYHNAWDTVARFNTLFDNPVNIFIVKSFPGTAYSYNQAFNNNISVCKTSDQLAFWIYNYVDGDPLTFGTSDNNYFLRPTLDTNPIRTTKPGNNTYYTLEQWRAASGQDNHSYKSPVAATEFLFEYNATKTNRVVPLTGRWTRVDGTEVSGSVTLLPYTSIVLMR